MKIIIFKSNDQFYFRIVARNGQIIAQSEGYTTKQSAQRTVKSLLRSLEAAKIIDQSF